MKTLKQFLDESMGGGVPLTPQELEIQKKMSRLNVRLARKRSQQMQKAKIDDTETAPEQVKEASAVLDANKKLEKEKKTKKDKAELAKLTHIYKGMKKGIYNSYEPEGELIEGKKKGLWDNIHAKRKRGEKPAKPGDKDYPKTLNVEGAAWTKKAGKNPEGGLNEKGRKSYERDNPGSDLKAPQPEGGSRKKSFCARMGGMKKKLTSSKTANDPDSRINKALRKWKCNEEDKAFNFVVNKLKAKYGSGVMTKGDKMPEPSAAQKKKNAAIRAKRAKEDHRDPTEKASDGRYSDRYSNRGSD